jgi:hypothetical protein
VFINLKLNNLSLVQYSGSSHLTRINCKQELGYDEFLFLTTFGKIICVYSMVSTSQAALIQFQVIASTSEARNGADKLF